MPLLNQRIVYLNGVFVPENEAVVPIKDQGFKYGDGVFDTTRTFGHKIFIFWGKLFKLFCPIITEYF